MVKENGKWIFKDTGKLQEFGIAQREYKKYSHDGEQEQQKKDLFKPKVAKVFNYTDEVKEIIVTENKGFGTSGGRKGKKSSEVSEEDRERNLRRVKRNVRRMAFANDLGQIHLTLTFAKKRETLQEYDDRFKKFMVHMHVFFPSLKYIATREIQESRQEKYGEAVIHYHVLLNQRVNIKKVNLCWNGQEVRKHEEMNRNHPLFTGWVTIVPHDNKMKAVLYVLKYIQKELGKKALESETGFTKKAYLSSKGLKKEVEGCVTKHLINTPQEYTVFNDGVNFIMTNLPEGWDKSFTVKVSDLEEIECRSIFACASSNY